MSEVQVAVEDEPSTSATCAGTRLVDPQSLIGLGRGISAESEWTRKQQRQVAASAADLDARPARSIRRMASR